MSKAYIQDEKNGDLIEIETPKGPMWFSFSEQKAKKEFEDRLINRK